MQKLTIKRKGQAKRETYFSEATAVVGNNKIMELTLTQNDNGDKSGAKFLLAKGDKVTIEVCGDTPKGKQNG